MTTEHNVAGVGRRAFLRALTIGAAATVASAPLVVPGAATESNEERRKARYQPNSLSVQTYYSVNRYPPTK